MEVAPSLLEEAPPGHAHVHRGTRDGHHDSVQSRDVPNPARVALETDVAGAPEAPAAEARRAAAPHAAKKPAAEYLDREVALLDEARRALARSDFATVLTLSSRYLAAYPSGRLEPEARYLKMRALRELGELSNAKNEARLLLELNPEGPHAAAARDITGQ